MSNACWCPPGHCQRIASGGIEPKLRTCKRPGQQPARSAMGVVDPVPVTVSFSMTVPNGLSADAVATLTHRGLLAGLPDAWEAGRLMIGYGQAHPGAMLVVRADTPPGGVTMLSNEGVQHLTAGDLEPDVRPTPDEVRAARERLAAGLGTFADYSTMSRSDEDVEQPEPGPPMHGEHDPCICGGCVTSDGRRL